MAYEDTIRVAELKIRATRFERVAQEVQAEGRPDPRDRRVHASAPAGDRRNRARRARQDAAPPRPAAQLVERLTSNGRVVKTTSISGFLQLYAVASLKPWRRKSLRYAAEQAHLDGWLKLVEATAAKDYALALELVECRNLVKGYGDTHERGKANYTPHRLHARQGGRTAPARQDARGIAGRRAGGRDAAPASGRRSPASD